jgi:hypothetical protein
VIDDADDVTLSYTLSPREYRRLSRGITLLQRPVQGFLATLWLVLVVSFFVYLTKGGTGAASVVWAALIFLGIAGVFLLIAPFVLWSMDRSLRDARKVTLSSQGITSVTSSSTTFFAWEGIRSEALENERLLCFVVKGKRIGVLIPKRAISSPAELEAIRELASVKVRTYVGFAARQRGVRERAEARGIA